jgi:hypothetical protein
MLATEISSTLQPPILLETVAPGRPCAYLAGPMRGYEDFNFPAFHEAAKHLREVVGWDVISPAEMDLAVGLVPTADGVLSLADWYTAMRRDIAALLEPRVDRIVFLPGWRDSRGANVERIVGEAIGLEMWFYIPGFDGDSTVTMFAT